MEHSCPGDPGICNHHTHYEAFLTQTHEDFPPLTRVNTVGSSETADNLPGPGRGLDQLYQHFGRKLERRLNSIAYWVRIKRATSSGTGPTDHEAVQSATSSGSTHSDVLSLRRVGTNETADNLPGPGRAQDRLYRFLGHKLERQIGLVASYAGFGPWATRRKVLRAMSVIDKTPFSESSKSKLSALSNLKRLRTVIAANSAKKGCNALVKYSRSTCPLTQLSALVSIITIRSRCSHSLEYFASEKTQRRLAVTFHELKELKTSANQFELWRSLYEGDCDENVLSELFQISHLVLLSVEKNHLNALVDQIPTQMSELKNLSEQEMRDAILTFFQYILHAEFASLALLYIINRFKDTFMMVYHSDLNIIVDLCQKLMTIIPDHCANERYLEIPHLLQFVPRNELSIRTTPSPRRNLHDTTCLVSIRPGLVEQALEFARKILFINFIRNIYHSHSHLEKQYVELRNEMVNMSEAERSCLLSAYQRIHSSIREPSVSTSTYDKKKNANQRRIRL